MNRLLRIVFAGIPDCYPVRNPSAQSDPLPSVLPTPAQRLQKYVARRAAVNHRRLTRSPALLRCRALAGSRAGRA
jgi:hypothetical protein